LIEEKNKMENIALKPNWKKRNKLEMSEDGKYGNVAYHS